MSFTALTDETRSWRQSDLNMQLHKMRPEQHQKHMDTLANKFFNLHSALADIVKKLMRDAACKDRVLLWLRQAVSLNLEKRKMFTQRPVATDGFVLNYIDLLLQLCKPFVGSFAKYGTFITKINSFYLINNEHVSKATDMEKISHEVTEKV